MPIHRRPLIAGNWKMHGLRADGVALAGDLAARMRSAGTVPFEMLLCPPVTALSAVADTLGGSAIALGAQDCHPRDKGAHTGDVSAAMLADAGCRYVIVGHSERRTNHGEDDALVRAKAGAAIAAGLAAIICIGETADERDGGETLDVVKVQLAGSVPDSATATSAVIAYEPVWAIGTGRTPTTDEVQDVHALIRGELSASLGEDEATAMRILYGGSMKPANAKALLALGDVDGGLIGGASLSADDFWAIAESCL